MSSRQISGMRKRAGIVRWSLAISAAAGTAAVAQPEIDPTDDAPLRTIDVALPGDSGWRSAQPGPIDNVGQVAWVMELTSPGAPWVQVNFDGATALAGDPAADNAAFLRITSVEDGAVQTLNSEHLRHWQNRSAYFNGDTVIVELVVFPGTGASRVVTGGLTAGQGPSAGRSICGTADNRVLSSDARSARLMTVGCTAWLFNDLNNTFLSAGHCFTSTQTVQFNVPLSTASGATVNPGPQDQYPVDSGSRQWQSPSVGGDDWYTFAAQINSQTGLTAAQAQGDWYTLSTATPALGSTIRITGYGTTASPISPTWNQAQKTHTGFLTARGSSALYYNADTTGGNSGSAVVNDSASGVAVGIHTNGGCTSSGGANFGTWLIFGNLQSALANPTGLQSTGRGTVAPGLYAIGDGQNNFGTLNRATGSFAKVARPPLMAQGMSWDWAQRVFYVVSSAPTGTASRNLYRVTESGAATLVGAISGTTNIINGLAYNPATRTLYGMIQSSGQLVTINTSTAAVTTVGSPNAGSNIGGIEFDPRTGVLYGVNDISGGTRLVTINTATGALTTVGTLGSGITDCNGLAYSDQDRTLYTINATSDRLLRVDPSSGAAVDVGSTGSVFNASFGMAFVVNCPADLDRDGDADLDDFFAFTGAFDAQTPDADLDGSGGDADLDDFFLFLGYFDAGC